MTGRAEGMATARRQERRSGPEDETTHDSGGAGRGDRVPSEAGGRAQPR